MTPEGLSPARDATAGASPASAPFSDELLEREVADFMTPGCVVISEAASVADAAKALERHRVHAVLVLGARNGTPLGWAETAITITNNIKCAEVVAYLERSAGL